MFRLIYLLLALLSLLSSLASCGIPGNSTREFKLPTVTANHDTIFLTDGCGDFWEINDYRETEGFFLSIVSDYGYDPDLLLIVEPDSLTGEILEHRSGAGFVLCERVIGVCLDGNSGDGRILNTKDGFYNYINYTGFDQPYTDGTIILTYLIYDAESDGVDDIADRFDYVLDREDED